MSEECENIHFSDISDYGSSSDSNFDDSLMNLLSPTEVEQTNDHKESDSNNYKGDNNIQADVYIDDTSNAECTKELTDSEHLSNNKSEIASSTKKLLTKLNSEQMKSVRELIVEVKDAYSDMKVSEFVLNSYKSTANHIQKDLAATLKGALRNSSLSRCINVKDKNTKSKIALFGLPENLIYEPLSKLNMSLCKKHTIEEFKLNANRLKKERDILEDTSDISLHYQNIASSDCPLVTEQKIQLNSTYSALKENLELSKLLIKENNEMMEELLTLKQASKQSIENSSYSSLSSQAQYLNIVSRIQKLKVDQISCQDKNQVTTSNTNGDDLKENIVHMKEKFKSLQSKLKDYERKETASKEYHDIVVQYAKIEKILDHKKQTLILLRSNNSYIGSSDENDDVSY